MIPYAMMIAFIMVDLYRSDNRSRDALTWCAAIVAAWGICLAVLGS